MFWTGTSILIVKSMDYQKIYNQIVERAKNRDLMGYSERHHIIPKCMGGLNNPSNLVKLTAREHLMCHRLLTLIHPENHKILYAFWAMCNQKNNSNQQRDYVISSRVYEETKLSFSKAHSNRVVTQSTRDKISKARAGKKNPNYNKETVSNLIEAGKSTRFKPGQSSWTKGNKLSEEHIKNRTESRKGYKTSEETKQKISIANRGIKRPWTDAQRLKQSESKKGKPVEKYACGCGKHIGGIGNFRKHIKVCISNKN
jgi:hypothetical protein